MSKLRKVFVDPNHKGCIRFVDDPTGGMIIGREAETFARVINCHDELLAAAKAALVELRRVSPSKASPKLRAAIAKATGGE